MSIIVPITPKEAKKQKIGGIPTEMFEAVNFLIVKNYKDSSFTILQKDIIDKFIELSIKNNRTDPEHISKFKERMFDENFLDFEDEYKKFGWNIEYDKPGFNESYAAFFTFSKK